MDDLGGFCKNPCFLESAIHPKVGHQHTELEHTPSNSNLHQQAINSVGISGFIGVRVPGDCAPFPGVRELGFCCNFMGEYTKYHGVY